jgi:hypothetical protein
LDAQNWNHRKQGIGQRKGIFHRGVYRICDAGTPATVGASGRLLPK